MKNRIYDVLVIDDEEVILDSVERICQEENIKTDRAIDANEAVKKLNEKEYKIILCDIMLPDQDGFYILDFLRKSANETIPVIMTTGYSTVENAVRSLQNGAIDFLPKPFTADELSGSIYRGLNFARILEDIKNQSKENNKDSIIYVPCPPKYLRLGVNSWIYKEYDGSVIIGVTDLFLKMVESVKSVHLIDDNNEVIQGYICARIETIDSIEHCILSPLTGRIIEVNNAVKTNSSIIEKDPYFEGWLYRMLPSNFGFESKYLTSCSIDML